VSGSQPECTPMPCTNRIRTRLEEISFSNALSMGGAEYLLFRALRNPERTARARCLLVGVLLGTSFLRLNSASGGRTRSQVGERKSAVWAAVCSCRR
jgi:hypothetical protein